MSNVATVRGVLEDNNGCELALLKHSLRAPHSSSLSLVWYLMLVSRASCRLFSVELLCMCQANCDGGGFGPFAYALCLHRALEG